MPKITTVIEPEVNPLLQLILQTRRPTNSPVFCWEFMTGLLDKLGIPHVSDIHYNITVSIGESDCCFTSHQDTVDNKMGTNDLMVQDGMLSVKGGGILGADDGAGIYILLRMILDGVPGYYVFFSQEEAGRIGSEKYAMPEEITKVISFDRKGTDNLIVEQMGERGVSLAFIDHFIKYFPLPFISDPTGSFTDSYSFFGQVSECCNLSIGYYNCHSKQECLDLYFLESMVEACLAMEWENLPAFRKPVATPSWGDGWDDVDEKFSKMEDFIYYNPDMTAAFLESYGITLGDLEDFKRSFDKVEGVHFEDDFKEDNYWDL